MPTIDEQKLFERYLSLDSELRRSVFPNLFGRMRYLAEKGTEAQKKAAATFFGAAERAIEDAIETSK